MSEISEDERETAASRFAEQATRPKRRARPRLAGALQAAEEIRIDTPEGWVTAWRLGVGPASLLTHGWEDDNALWGPLIDACERIARAVVVFDLPGHGRSGGDACSFEQAGVTALAVAEQLGPVDSAIGHSFGCVATIRALARGLEVPRVVLIAPPIPNTRLVPYYDEGWRQERIDQGAEPWIVERAADILRQALLAREAGPQSVASAARQARAKALILHSIDDDATPYTNAEALAAIWPDAQLVLTEGLGHRLIAQDSATIQRIIDFVEGF